jgi:hypothetical protein
LRLIEQTSRSPKAISWSEREIDTRDWTQGSGIRRQDGAIMGFRGGRFRRIKVRQGRDELGRGVGHGSRVDMGCCRILNWGQAVKLTIVAWSVKYLPVPPS